MAGNFPEILAPVGGREQLEAAVRCSADAVYLGTKAFNARQNATNFQYDEFKAAVDYCHIRGVKVYQVLNTLVSDAELDDALEQVRLACEAGVDALIVQDLGLAGEIRKRSDIPLHASTQMSVGTLEGIKLLHSLGFKRAVLPRELSFSEIEYIAKNSPIELECFVHGALCMCVSGQCLLSAVLGSRSGNRGLCAQPCRLPFSSRGDGECHLSLKDLSLVDELEKLREIGIASFKIEGRMKRAEYVAAAVTACRRALNNDLSPEIQNSLRSVFSRSGFTKGHFENKRDGDMFGTRRKEDVVSASSVLKSLEKLYEKEVAVVPVRFSFTMKHGHSAVLTASTGEFQACAVSQKMPEVAIKKSLDSDSVAVQIQKCGGTPFFAENIETEIEQGLTLPLSEINSMRRACLDELSRLLCTKRAYTFDVSKSDKPMNSERKTDEKQIFARFSGEDSFIDGICDVAYLPLAECAKSEFRVEKFKTKIYAELPRMFFGSADTVRVLMRKSLENGVYGFLAGGLDGLALAREFETDIHAAIGVNAYNGLTVRVLSELGVSHTVLSAELTTRQIEKMHAEIKKGAFAYGRLPLMIARACPNENIGGCKACKEKSLTDRMGVKFPLCCGYGFTEMFNSRPVYMGDRMDELKCDFVFLYFTDENKAEIRRITDSYKNSLPPKGEFTRGLLYRGSF